MKVNSSQLNLKLATVFAFTVYCVLSLLTLDPHQGWGGDFAHYLINARNILLGRPYQFLLETMPIGNPGYPAFLAILTAIAGESFLIYKIPNIFFWLLICLLVRQYYRREGCTLVESFLIFLLFLTLRYAFQFKTNILPDLLFCLVSLTSLLFIAKTPKDRIPTAQVFMIVSLLCVGTVVKPANIALVAAATAFFIFRKNAILVLSILGSQGVIYFAQQKMLGANAMTNHLKIAEEISGAGKSVIGLEFALKFLRRSFFQASQINLGFFDTFLGYGLFRINQIEQSDKFLISIVVMLIFFVLLTIGVWRKIKVSGTWVHIDVIFTVFYGSMLCLWHTNIDHRYLLPILPFITFYQYLGITFCVAKVSKYFGSSVNWPRLLTMGLAASLIFINLFRIGSDVKNGLLFAPAHSLNTRLSTNVFITEVYDWIKKNAEKDLSVGFYKPRTMAYFTDFRSFGVRAPRHIENAINRESFYLVLARSSELNPQMQSTKGVQIAFSNEGYLVYFYSKKRD